MNVKKYRASTAREALQQVKQELGENAFVLETKQVSTGGFLGLNAKKQIEISATATLEPETEEDLVPFQRNTKKGNKVNLVDNSDADPDPTPVVPADKRERILNALSVRAATSNTAESIMPATQMSPMRSTQIEPVEISKRAPRIVHARKPTRKTAPTQKVEKPVTVDNDTRLLRAELRELKIALNARQPVSYPFNDDAANLFEGVYSDIFSYLSYRGVTKSHLVNSIDVLMPELERSNLPESKMTKMILQHVIETAIDFTPGLLSEQKRIAFIGATGVGKTTTIAKLAARESLNGNKKVELLTLDTYRIAAVDQLKTYAEIIGANCDILRSVEELDERLASIDNDTTVLIDTTGRSPYDLSDQFEVSDYLASNDSIHKCLTIQASINPRDAMTSVQRFEMYGTDSLVVTKLDETNSPGAALALATAARRPISYICIGQRVPEDIRKASVSSLTNQILLPDSEFLRLSA